MGSVHNILHAVVVVSMCIKCRLFKKIITDDFKCYKIAVNAYLISFQFS